jgi:hypothetical protein
VPAPYGHTLPQYELDTNSEEYKQTALWIEQVQEAKKQWMAMRMAVLDIAKRVTIARSL